MEPQSLSLTSRTTSRPAAVTLCERLFSGPSVGDHPPTSRPPIRRRLRASREQVGPSRARQTPFCRITHEVPSAPFHSEAGGEERRQTGVTSATRLPGLVPTGGEMRRDRFAPLPGPPRTPAPRRLRRTRPGCLRSQECWMEVGAVARGGGGRSAPGRSRVSLRAVGTSGCS